MDFLRTSKRRTLFNEAIYIALNIGLAISLMLLIKITGSLWPAFVLVLLSKWRIFAVRPRFWFANIQANMVSITVSISYVIFLYAINGLNAEDGKITALQIIMVILYTIWLLYLKPKSKRSYIVVQAGVALLVGVTAIYMVSYGWMASPVVLLMWLVGYATSRHVLNSYDDENQTTLLSMSWGFIMAEIGWVAYHWTVAYKLPLVANIYLPQVTITVLGFSFLAYVVYNSFYHHGRIRFNDIVLPLVFVVSTISLLVFVFNGAGSTL